VRSPEQLRLHRALEEIEWAGDLQLDAAAQRASHSLLEPILITTAGTILAGFGRWQLAVIEGELEIPCIDCALNEDEALPFILAHHQLQRGWYDFVRIRLALKLKSAFQRRALDNMRAGGRHKGLANLPDPQRIDVRQEIANIAAVCPRNVSNVETILETAHPRLIEALQSGTLRINRAMQFCRLPRAKQLEEFVRFSEERAINKVIRRAIPQPKVKNAGFDIAAVLDALQRQEAGQAGSVAVRLGRLKQTLIVVGQDVVAKLPTQKELKLK
jgi:hypothetical protein